jgi:4-amino-4-deoxy-L-arabinose transferase-like glycosyltransferase
MEETGVLRMPIKINFHGFFRKENLLLMIIAGVGFIIQIVFGSMSSLGYGYFGDEFYYMACSSHLDLGYVDQPPLSCWILFIVRLFLGDSLFALRLVPALGFAVSIFLCGLLARRLGGSVWAQGAAALALLASPIMRVVASFYSMNIFETLLWLAATLVVFEIIANNRHRLWLLFGALFGLALLNKHTSIVLGLGLLIGLVISKKRKALATPWPWFGVGVAFLVFSPNIVWQILNGFPSLEFYVTAAFKNVPTNPLMVLFNQILGQNPFSLLVWGAGLYFLFIDKRGRDMRPFGWTYVIGLAFLMATMSSRPDRLMAAYPVLLASGAIVWEGVIMKRGLSWLKPVIPILMVLVSLAGLPITLPILPPDMTAAYSETIGIVPKIENWTRTPLPQWLADRIDWEELAQRIADVGNTLSPGERKTTAVFCQSYGIAGALEFYGKEYGIPPVLCVHNNYFFWSNPDQGFTTFIIIGLSEKEVGAGFREYTSAGEFRSPYSESLNQLVLTIARKPRIDIKKLFIMMKKFI